MRRFVSFILAAAVIAALVFAVNVTINPFGVWRSFADRYLPDKTQRINSLRLVKAYDLFHGCPDHIITGMSTAVWGIDPKLYPDKAHVLYNGGIVGSSMIEQHDYVMRYLTLCPNISTVYLDINSESFGNFRINAPDFVQARLQGKVLYPPDLAFTSFSKSAVIASFTTLETHLSGIVNDMVYDTGNGFHRLIESSNPSVYYTNFRNTLAAVRKTARYDTHNSNLQIAHFKELVEELHAKGIKIIPFFGPLHMFIQYRFTTTGYAYKGSRWDQYADLKRRVAQITPFYDFNEYNPYNSEDIKNARYFIDEIHYRPRLGALVLSALTGHREGLPPDFGKLVTKDTIDDNLRAQREGIARWAQQYPAYAEEISAMFDKAKPASIPELHNNW